MDHASTTTLNVRSIERATVDRIKRSAHLREMTVGQYLAQLVALHDAVRARADAGDDGLQAELTAIGLQTIQG